MVTLKKIQANHGISLTKTIKHEASGLEMTLHLEHNPEFERAFSSVYAEMGKPTKLSKDTLKKGGSTAELSGIEAQLFVIGEYLIQSWNADDEDGEEVKPNGENFTAICAQLTEAESEKDKGGFLTWVFNEFGSLSTEYKKKLDDAKKKSLKSTSTKRK